MLLDLCENLRRGAEHGVALDLRQQVFLQAHPGCCYPIPVRLWQPPLASPNKILATACRGALASWPKRKYRALVPACLGAEPAEESL